MPFPQADIYASTLSHDRVYDNNDEQRLSLAHPFSPLSKKLNSAQFFTVALLLFIATGVQAYYETAPTTTPYYSETTDVLFTVTRHLVLAVKDSLSPLMILACTVAMAGTLCRGLELVIQAAAFKGK